MSALELMPVGHFLALYVLSGLWGLVTLGKMAWGIVKYGPRDYFYSQDRSKRPEVLESSEYGTHHFARINDIRLHYVSNGPDGAPLMLFVHGFPEFWYSWRHQLKEFSKDYRAVAFDMRGYGQSDKPQKVSEYHMTKLTDDIKYLIQHLGYSSCVLVAHDWGGLVAWPFTAKYPAMVERLVVCDCPHPEALRQYAKTHVWELLQAWYMYVFQLPYLGEAYLRARDSAFLREILTDPQRGGLRTTHFSHDELEAYLYTFRNYEHMTGPLNYYRAMLRYKPEPLPTTRVRCPTLVLWGAQDFFVNQRIAPASRSFVDNDCMVSVIKDASHWLQQDQPEVVNDRIRHFLSQHAS